MLFVAKLTVLTGVLRRASTAAGVATIELKISVPIPVLPFRILYPSATAKSTHSTKFVCGYLVRIENLLPNLVGSNTMV